VANEKDKMTKKSKRRIERKRSPQQSFKPLKLKGIPSTDAQFDAQGFKKK